MPGLYITNIPPRWRDKTSNEIPVVTKKRVFFRLLGPLILQANELIQAGRAVVWLCRADMVVWVALPVTGGEGLPTA